MNECLFCEIASGRMAKDFLFEDDRVLAFRDINPQAPYHILIIPRRHFESIKDMSDENLIGHMFTVGNRVAGELGIHSFRYVINTGREAGQQIYHLHLHLIGGRILGWPPG